MLIETRYEKCDECGQTAARLFAGHCMPCVSDQLSISADVDVIEDATVDAFDAAVEAADLMMHDAAHTLLATYKMVCRQVEEPRGGDGMFACLEDVRHELKVAIADLQSARNATPGPLKG